MELTKEEILEVIHKVALNHQAKKFDYHTEEDIYQEVWVICWSKMEEFNPDRGTTTKQAQALENWLNRVVATRLANFYRDNFGVKHRKLKCDKSETEHQKRINLSHPIDLSFASEVSQLLPHSVNYTEELWQYILSCADKHISELLQSILSGEHLNSYYRLKLVNFLNNKVAEYAETTR